jgi:N utilization substance protein A
MLVALGENEIRSLDDLADLAGDELVEILGGTAPEMDEANAIIMAARAHWFEGEDAVAPVGAEGAAVEASAEAAAEGEIRQEEGVERA